MIRDADVASVLTALPGHELLDGVDHENLSRLTRGGNSQFAWFVDGELRTHHNTMPVYERRGTDPNALLPLAAAIGDCDPVAGSFTVDYDRTYADHEVHDRASAAALCVRSPGSV